MTLPIETSYAAMEAELADELPGGDGWIYEPKWDGFRCLAFKDGGEVTLISKAGKPLGRYFPEVVETLASLKIPRFVLDGELVIPVAGMLSFDELLLRIHPAESRVKKLAAATPAHFIAFDLLVDGSGKDLSRAPLAKRRESLEALVARSLAGHPTIHLSPSTRDLKLARRWLAGENGGLDGVMAKQEDLAYTSGERTGMIKVKRMRTADCVVGGFRFAKTGKLIGSLLLGLYNDAGKLDHVGFCSALNRQNRADATERLVPLRGGSGFTGKAPVGVSRWRKEGTGEWESVRPEIVVEVEYDHFSGGRFRHGTRFLRWRPDKSPQSCKMAQVEKESRTAMRLL